MSTENVRRTLIVANLTASTPILVQEVERRADEAPTRFALLVPAQGSRNYADWTLEQAVRVLGRAANGPVEGIVGGADPFESIRDAVAGGAYDDVILSTLPKGRSEWLRRDLPSRVEQLGIPVTVISQPDEGSPLKAFVDSFSAREPPPRR
jgi:hypothetical protein